jgi:hypothetical protein
MEPTPHQIFAAIQNLPPEQVCALLFAASQHSSAVAERIMEAVTENLNEEEQAGEEEEEEEVQAVDEGEEVDEEEQEEEEKCEPAATERGRTRETAGSGDRRSPPTGSSRKRTFDEADGLPCSMLRVFQTDFAAGQGNALQAAVRHPRSPALHSRHAHCAGAIVACACRSPPSSAAH